MNEVVIKKIPLVVNWGDQKIKLRKPTIDETDELVAKTGKLDETKAFGVLKEFLVAMGWPKDTVGTLDLDEVQQVQAALFPKKK